MKLIFFSHDSSLYGASRSMVNLISGLQKKDHKVLLFIPEQGEIELILKLNNINYQIVTYKQWILVANALQPTIPFYKVRSQIFKLKRLIVNVSRALKIKKQVNEFDPQYIISNTSTTPIGFITSIICHTPHIWHIREFGFEDHGHDFDFGLNTFKWTLKKSYLNIFISKVLKSKYSFPAIENKCCVLYNGLYTENELNLIQSLQPSERETFTFILLGQVKKTKGHQIALEALQILLEQKHDIKLLIVGGGDINQFSEQAYLLGISNNVTFTDHVQEPSSYLKKSDALIICSESEAFGRVILEAWAHGLPVIGNYAGAIPEIIENSKTGLLYNGTASDLAEMMESLINSKELYNNLKFNAISQLKKDYTIEKCSDSFIRFLT